MLLVLFVGIIAGFITGISPCILPVLPVILTSSGTDRNRARPFVLIAGLVASFACFTLIGGSLLDALHLPQDFLRDLGIALLGLIGVSLFIPGLTTLIERPFSRLGRAAPSSSASRFIVGASLGLVFVPCAGPVLAAISVVSATHRVGTESVFLTIAYSLGVAVPLCVFAILGQRATSHLARLRKGSNSLRRVAGAILVLTSIAFVFNLTSPFQTFLPGYTSALENHIESSPSVSSQLDAITGEHANRYVPKTTVSTADLPMLGQAPNFTGITAWLNTPGDRPLSLKELRGKVVLVDFWTYSCINCQRSLPHVEAWYARYKKDGFVVVGVHTPEFDFEHVLSNVRAAAAQLKVDYPIAIDNNYGTWDAYNNDVWPAEYLIDQHGEVRDTQFGEGNYSETEQAIRTLLRAGGAKDLPPATDVPNKTPTEPTTEESYIGYERIENYVGVPIVENTSARYQLPAAVPPDEFSLGGTWRVGPQGASAVRNAKIELNFMASDVYLVLSGTGRLSVSLGGSSKEIVVSGIPRLYTLYHSSSTSTGTLHLSFSGKITAYDFTFG